MAVKKINPFNIENFKFIVADDVQKIIKALNKNPSFNGWRKTLIKYKFKKYKYCTGVKARRNFQASLESKVKLDVQNVSRDEIDAMTEITSWGGMAPFESSEIEKIKGSLVLLNNEYSWKEMPFLYSYRIASVSKIYEMWDPKKWIIYDSYCIRGLQWLIREAKIKKNILQLPWPPGRSNDKIEGFKTLGTTKQATLGFIYASWLCRLIAEELNQNKISKSKFTWEAFHVEMLLFYLGHQV